jgi:leucyl aminopeptidase
MKANTKLDISFKKPKKAAHPVQFESGEATSVDRQGKKTFYVAGGELATIENLDFIRLLRKVIREANALKLEEVAVRVKDIRALASSNSIPDKLSDFDLGALVGENFAMAHYEFNRYKTKPKEASFQVGKVYLPDASKDFKKGLKRGMLIGEKANVARDWANTPAQDMTPKIFAEQVREELEQYAGVNVQIMSGDAIEEQKLGLIHGVGKGAANPPQLIVAEYRGAENDDPWIALVGKGVMYDTGGLSLKPSEGMLEMHLDMSGGASVLAAFSAVAALGLKVNLVTCVPAVENAISADAQRPGDIVTSYSGKTVEVQNTDAEGRLILADAVAYVAKTYKPRLMLDAATLTGASLIALGQAYTGLFTKDDELADQLIGLGNSCDELLWRLPVTKHFTGLLKKNTRADIKNIVSHGHKWGGASTGAAFVLDFVPSGITCAHLDIAPRMESIDGDQLAPGATGVLVRLLVRAIEKLYKTI